MMQKHYIDQSLMAINVLNPGQVLVDVADQPLYALSKEVQINIPNYGFDKYFP